MIAYIGLGSNLGDRFDYIVEAIRRLGETSEVHVLAVSRVYESTPVGGPQQPRYLNAAVKIATTLSTDDLLGRCQSVESELGRIRNEHWGPRVIDLDLLIAGEARISTERLTVPHPRIHERGFVLIPLCDIDPALVIPGLQHTVTECLTNLSREGIYLRDDLHLPGEIG